MTTRSKAPEVDETDDAVEPETEKKNLDVDALSPDSEFVTLTTGTDVRVVRLRTRETLKFLKILITGGGSLLGSVNWSSAKDDQEAFVGQLLALFIAAIPNAEDEVIEFIQAMVLPVDYIERPRTKEQRKANDELLSELFEELENPEFEDTINIVTRIIKNEAGDIAGLGKRLGAMIPMALNI